MRAPRVAVACGLVAVVALFALRDGGRHPSSIARPAAAAASGVLPAPIEPAKTTAPPARAPVRIASAPGVPTAVPPAAKPPAPAPDPRRTVFPLSSDHQALVQDTVLASADHERLEHESRDDAWATESERLIRQELARRASAADFDVIAVDCRQTLCAIEAVSYGENGQRAWVDAMDAAFSETLGNVFDSINTAFPPEGSRAPVLTFLHRRSVANGPSP